MSEFASTYYTLAPRYDDWASGVLPNVRPEWVHKIEPLVSPRERVVARKPD
jgi:hypothetical protein